MCIDDVAMLKRAREQGWFQDERDILHVRGRRPYMAGIIKQRVLTQPGQ